MIGLQKSQDIIYQPLCHFSSDADVEDFSPVDGDNDPLIGSDQTFGVSDRNQNGRAYRTVGPLTLQFKITFLSFQQVKAILYIVMILLFLFFLVQLKKLINTDKQTKSEVLSKTSAIHVINIHHSKLLQEHPNQQINETDLDQTQSVILKRANKITLPAKNDYRNLNKLPNYTHERPQYDNYLTSVLRDHGSISDLRESLSFDDLLYPYDTYVAHNENGEDSHRQAAWWELKFRLDEKYVVLENYIRAMKSFNENSSITLTTQATTNFMHHTIELCKRWDGPISVAVFCPGVELSIAVTSIKYLRQCLPEPLSACIRDKITWHLVYNREHGPPANMIGFPRDHMDKLHYPLFVQIGQCPKVEIGSSDTHPFKKFEIQLREKNQIYPGSYMKKFGLIYPINVLRNVAKQTAKTSYIMASDIELYPSARLVPRFINLLKNHDLTMEYSNLRKFVFALPIFEIKSNFSAPRTKQELVKLFKDGNAVFFHKWVCDACQKFPNRQEWLKSDIMSSLSKGDHEESDELAIFEVTRRDKSLEFWEPIFIGTKDDPDYDDRLSWDGRRDKMGQMYEMCLQGYQLLVLGNAFLVHAPGIKHFDKEDFDKRAELMRQNNAIYDKKIAELKRQYRFSEEIKIC